MTSMEAPYPADNRPYRHILRQSTAADGRAWLESQDPNKEWDPYSVTNCIGAQYYKHIAGDNQWVSFGAAGGHIAHHNYPAPAWLLFVVSESLRLSRLDGEDSFRRFTTTDLLGFLAKYETLSLYDSSGSPE